MIVHPDYQNKGLIKFVADKLFNDAALNRISFIYGYPNEKLTKYTNNFFLTKIFQCKIISQKLDNKLIINRTNSFTVEKANNFSKAFDSLNNVKKQRKICLNRNINFLKWRYLQRPDYSYDFFI